MDRYDRFLEEMKKRRLELDQMTAETKGALVDYLADLDNQFQKYANEKYLEAENEILKTKARCAIQDVRAAETEITNITQLMAAKGSRMSTEERVSNIKKIGELSGVIESCEKTLAVCSAHGIKIDYSIPQREKKGIREMLMSLIEKIKGQVVRENEDIPGFLENIHAGDDITEHLNSMYDTRMTEQMEKINELLKANEATNRRLQQLEDVITKLRSGELNVDELKKGDEQPKKDDTDIENDNEKPENGDDVKGVEQPENNDTGKGEEQPENNEAGKNEEQTRNDDDVKGKEQAENDKDERTNEKWEEAKRNAYETQKDAKIVKDFERYIKDYGAPVLETQKCVFFSSEKNELSKTEIRELRRAANKIQSLMPDNVEKIFCVR